MGMGQHQQVAMPQMNPASYIRGAHQNTQQPQNYGASGMAPQVHHVAGILNQQQVQFSGSSSQAMICMCFMHFLHEFICCFTNNQFIAQRSLQIQQQLNEIAHILERIKNPVSQSDKENAFADLKKTPHMFSAFLELQKNSVRFNL